MQRRTICAVIITAIITQASVFADARFSIRYHDKNIYYPGDEVSLKLTLSNPMDSMDEDLSFFLADDARLSFGFDARSLSGQPAPVAATLPAALSRSSSYRPVHLSPGQEMSVTVNLSDWVNLSEPGQYRLTGYFFPDLRGGEKRMLNATTVLDLTVLPQTGKRWQEELDAEVVQALALRDLDPKSVVMETFESRSFSRYNRALVYMDLDSLAQTSSGNFNVEDLKSRLLEGDWSAIPGFEHPALTTEFVSARVLQNEATVRLNADFEPFGERFSRQLRVYLHNPEGYWAIRRVEAVGPQEMDSTLYGRLDLEPPTLVNELLKAITRGDWDVALRYYDVESIVRQLPTHRDRWNRMSAAEHERAITDYREALAAGTLEDGQLPLKDLEDWRLSRVSYTEEEGSITVENQKVYDAADGPLARTSLYTFRLRRDTNADGFWRVVGYDTVNLGRDL
ncbi:MAG: hypothetical protein MI717_00585 [Spirochaetales bacterium]|nr:hypothetical protein [Spirochaetales bacterium]